MEKTFEEIQLEFDGLVEDFESMKELVFKDESLHTIMAKHPLYEIEPFFTELNNEFFDENTPSKVVFTAEDFNPETDELYEFKINMETRKPLFRSEIFGGGVSYDTVYCYSDDHYKSATIYINPELKNPIKLAYLFFKDGMPHHYVECGQYGMVSQKYKVEGNRLLGYRMGHNGSDFRLEVDFEYDYDGALARIIRKNIENGRESLVFQRPREGETLEGTLETIENLLVEEISDQILEKVKIHEKVYCILLEYTMQGAFPPTIGIGVVSDIEGDMDDMEPYELYNAPDMQYFSEDETLPVDFDSLDLQAACLFFDRAYKLDAAGKKISGELVFQLYLKVCKRLMHVDFSASFAKTDNFLVMAKEFEECNEEAFLKEMTDYKRTIQL